jgi:cytochrome c peroxidase
MNAGWIILLIILGGAPQICAKPNIGGSATQVALSPADRTRSNDVYNHWALSLSAFEHSLSVSPFTPKFDAFLAGKYTMTSDEAAGYKLFRGKGNCNSCHSTADRPHRHRLRQRGPHRTA